MARDWLTTGAVVVTALAVGGGAVYFAERATHAGATSSGHPGATSTSSATTTGTAGPGPNSTGSATSTGHSTGSATTTGSGSASSGQPHGIPNESGGTVTLQAPSSLAVGSMGQLLARASGITNPLYQFWWKEPGSTVWQQTGTYSATPSADITGTASGAMETVAFARSASAPSGEAKAIRPQYEAESAVVTISVT